MSPRSFSPPLHEGRGGGRRKFHKIRFEFRQLQRQRKHSVTLERKVERVSCCSWRDVRINTRKSSAKNQSMVNWSTCLTDGIICCPRAVPRSKTALDSPIVSPQDKPAAQKTRRRIRRSESQKSTRGTLIFLELACWNSSEESSSSNQSVLDCGTALVEKEPRAKPLNLRWRSNI